MRKSIILASLLLCSLVVFAQATAGFTKIGNVSTLTFTDTSCPNLSTCGYQVTALDSTGVESIPATCGTTVLCIGGNIAIAQMPSSGTHTVTLTWTASTTTGVTYNIYRHIGPFPASGLGVVVN